MGSAEQFYEGKLDGKETDRCSLCEGYTDEPKCTDCGRLTCDECREEHLTEPECGGVCTHCPYCCPGVEDEEPETRRDVILDVVDDLVTNFTYYDRKDCESLPKGEIEAAVAAGEITVDDMVAKFRECLENCIPTALQTDEKP